MNKKSKIYLAGHTGMAGSAILRKLESFGYTNIIKKTSSELDLRCQKQVEAFFKSEKPEYVFLAAAKVGGILANMTYPADFLYDNLMIEANVIHNAYKYNTKKLLFLGSSCIYPKYANQPIKEEELLSGHLEPTNEAYAIAKISGISLCKFYRRQYDKNFISAMPTNLYGPNDNFDLETAHVLPALIRRFHDAKVTNKSHVTLWGTGTPKREFLYVDDLADACLFLMNNYDSESHINIGTGKDIEIKTLAELVKNTVDYQGNIHWDHSIPDGTPRKLLDISKLHDRGWKHYTNFKEGIYKTYYWYKDKLI